MTYTSETRELIKEWLDDVAQAAYEEEQYQKAREAAERRREREEQGCDYY